MNFYGYDKSSSIFYVGMTKGSTLESNRYCLLLKHQMSVPNNGLNEAETTLKIDLESKHIIEDFLGV